MSDKKFLFLMEMTVGFLSGEHLKVRYTLRWDQIEAHRASRAKVIDDVQETSESSAGRCTWCTPGCVRSAVRRILLGMGT